MDSDSSRGILADGEKPLDDAVARGGAVDEEEVLVVEAGVSEFLGFVHPLVEPDDGGDSVASEVPEVVVGSMQRVAVFNPATVVGASEC